MKTGVVLIAEEHARQILKEGWTEKHDDAHDHREMAQAACAYVMHYVERSGLIGHFNIDIKNYRTEILSEPLDMWPEDWAIKWFKPETPLRSLVKAGALIAAEIDRLQRAQPPAPSAAPQQMGDK